MNYHYIYHRPKALQYLQQSDIYFYFLALRRLISNSLKLMYIFIWGNQVGSVIERLGLEAVNHQNDDIDQPDLLHFVIQEPGDDENDTGAGGAPVLIQEPNPTRRNRYASKLATMCRLEIPGVEIHSASNTLVAKHFISRRLAMDNVRFSHRLSILNRALLFVRTPTLDDIVVRQMAQASIVLERQRAGRIQYHSRGPRTLWNWFGAKLSEPEPPGC